VTYSREQLTTPLHVLPHVRPHDTNVDVRRDVRGDLEASQLASRRELENRAAAIRSTAERIVNGPVLDGQFIEGLAKLKVPLSLLTDKMTELGDKAERKGKPIGHVRYFGPPLAEYADWYQRRQATPAAPPSLITPEGDPLTQSEHDAVMAEIQAITSPESQRRIDIILALTPQPRLEAQQVLLSAKVSAEAFDRHIERFKAQCSPAS